jgi:prepilin signal peptidase PulO-like enzyme (type II secretory pathway)
MTDPFGLREITAIERKKSMRSVCPSIHSFVNFGELIPVLSSSRAYGSRSV